MDEISFFWSRNRPKHFRPRVPDQTFFAHYLVIVAKLKMLLCLCGHLGINTAVESMLCLHQASIYEKNSSNTRQRTAVTFYAIITIKI